jgi:integrase
MESRKLVKTKDPGIFKRGARYVVVYRDPNGQQKKRAAATLAEARDIKAGLRTDISRGEYVPQSKLTLNDYYKSWLVTYTGRTRSGIRQTTLEGYADRMRLHVLPTLGRCRLAEIGPRDIKQLGASLYAKGLSANSVRVTIAPLKALLACAFEEELIRRNPAANVRLAQPKTGTDDGLPKIKSLTVEELQRLIAAVPEQHRLVVELLGHTGLRIGELIALTWADIDFGRKRVQVQRRWYRGSFAPPKSKFGIRQVPLTHTMAQKLWTLRGRDDELIFGTRNNTPMGATNFYNRVFKPAAVKAGVPWATFHTLRHTCASILFNNGGLNPKQVQAWLGHHAASFTLDTYVHLLEEDIAEAPDALDELSKAATQGQQDTPKQTETLGTTVALVPLNEAVSAVSA